MTVAVNNTLTRFTVPQGYTKWGVESQGYPAGYSTLEYNFDFFNYAGIHRCHEDFKKGHRTQTTYCRPVSLYTTPKKLFISDITTSTK